MESAGRRGLRAIGTGLACGCALLLASVTPVLAGTYVYWVQSSNTIGRANIDGTGVAAQWPFVSSGKVFGLARDTGHLYFPNDESQSNFRSIAYMTEALPFLTLFGLIVLLSAPLVA